MKTDFTSYWQRATELLPELADPEFVFILKPDAIKVLVREAFEAGVVHHAKTTRFLSQAAADEARDKMLGPESLRPEFEEIFGADRRAV